MARSIRRRKIKDQLRAERRRRNRADRLPKRATTVAGLTVGAGALLAAPAQAAEIEVTSNADAGPGSLRQAILDANATPADDTITFSSSLSGDTITLTSGQISIVVDDGTSNGDLAIQGPGAGQLTVDGNDNDRIFSASGAGALSIDGLTFTGGYAEPKYFAGGSGNPPKYLGMSGGAISSSVTDLTITGSVFTGNESSAAGGAISHGGASFDFDGLTVNGNTGSFVGGITASQSGSGEGTVTDSTISGNVASGAIGPSGGPNTKYIPALAGGLQASSFSGGTVGITGVTVRENEARNQTNGTYNSGAGGLYTDGPITVSESTITSNSAERGAGGVRTASETVISRSTISGNSGSIGGIEARDYDTSTTDPPDSTNGLILSNSTVSGNSATGSSTTRGARNGYGGGVYLRGQVGATIQNSTIAGNTASQGGGGIFSYAGDFSPYQSIDRSISSTIVADNTAAGSPNDLGSDSTSPPDVGFSAGFSLIENPGSADLASNPAGSNITGQDPQLGPLADNGGPTRTQLPADSSPAVDKGTANGLAVDQRGEPRTSQRPVADAADGTDIGSVELPADVTAPTVTITSGPGEGEKVIGDSVSFAFTADEDGSTFECMLDSGNWQPCTSPQTYDDLSSGDFHTFKVRATDAVGNTGSATIRTFKTIGGFCNGTPATMVAEPGELTIGTPGDDVIVGTDEADEIKGLGGDDQICALGGDDLVLGGEGDDAITGDQGADQIDGGEGDDGLFGAGGSDLLVGDLGDDLLEGANGDDRLRGNGGDDEIRGSSGLDDLRGNAGFDALSGGADDDVVRGDADDDLIKGNGGSDELRGAGGDDEIRGAGKPDELFGGAGDDLLNGGKGKNSCAGGAGENKLVNCD